MHPVVSPLQDYHQTSVLERLGPQTIRFSPELFMKEMSWTSNKTSGLYSRPCSPFMLIPA